MHKPAVEVTQKRLKQIVKYDSLTGIFVWLPGRKGVRAWRQAGSVDSNGYRYIAIDKRWYLASRLAWLYVNGEWPTAPLSFKDKNTDNCAIENLTYGKWSGIGSSREVKNAYDKAHRQSNPDWHRKVNLKRDFGISLEQYQAAFVAQGGVCACCGKPETSERSGKRKWLAVDHDHTDNSFRGLLCSSCNNMLGRAKDDSEVLRRAAAYLEAHASKPKTNVIPLAGRRIAGMKE